MEGKKNTTFDVGGWKTVRKNCVSDAENSCAVSCYDSWARELDFSVKMGYAIWGLRCLYSG